MEDVNDILRILAELKLDQASILQISDVVLRMMAKVEQEVQFSSTLEAITCHRLFRGTVRLITVGGRERIDALIPVIIEQLEYNPWIALAMLRELAPSPPNIPPHHAGNLYWLVEYWIRWAKKHGYITERSHRFLAWVRIHREITERVEHLLIRRKTSTGRVRVRHESKIVQLGRQYKSIVLPIIVTRWALGQLSDEDGNGFMTAITTIKEPAANERYAPPTVPPREYDRTNLQVSWYEWLRRWAPVETPYRLWSD